MKAFPGKKPVEIWSLVSSNRQSVVALADVKSRQPAPVFVDWFTWQPPLFDNRMRAFHMRGYLFLVLQHGCDADPHGRRPETKSAVTKMAGSLLQFMKTGDPNGGGLPNWPKYTSAKGETMVLDDTCEEKDDPDREARRGLPALT